MCIGENRGDGLVLGPRGAISNQRLPHTSRQEGGGIGIAIPIETGNERGVYVSVPEGGEWFARARRILFHRGGCGGGRVTRGDDGGVTNEKGTREVEGPTVEIPLPSPHHEWFLITDRMAKENVVSAALVFERHEAPPCYSRNEPRGRAHDGLSSVMEAVHLVSRVNTDSAGGCGRGEDSPKTGVVSGHPSNPRILWEGCIGPAKE